MSCQFNQTANDDSQDGDFEAFAFLQGPPVIGKIG